MSDGWLKSAQIKPIGIWRVTWRSLSSSKTKTFMRSLNLNRVAMGHNSKWIVMAVKHQITKMDVEFQKLCQAEPWETRTVVGKLVIQKTN